MNQKLHLDTLGKFNFHSNTHNLNVRQNYWGTICNNSRKHFMNNDTVHNLITRSTNWRGF